MNDSSTPQTIEQSCEINGSVDEQICSSNEGFSESLCTLSKKELGRKGERAAVRFLKNRGFEILETNWVCFAGEADIIALDGSTLCFVEVKTRTGVQEGFPSEAVNAKKRDRYEKIAACYLQTYHETELYVRFDVISILVLSDNHAFLRLHTNAFSCDH